MDEHRKAEPITAAADADAAKRPLDLNKETLKDLDREFEADAVRGGMAVNDSEAPTCGCVRRG